MRLLIAEDNRDISKALVTLFEKQNYIVDAVYNGKDALDYALIGNYEGIILDIMMPVYDGIEVLKKLRSENITTPVLLLSAKSELDDRVSGLDAGADDYLTKPFAVSELLSRVRAMLRRRNTYHPDIMEINGVRLNRGTLELSYGENSVRLVAREFQVFEMLIENSKQIVSTDSFIENIWGFDTDVEINIVWVTISNIRKKLQTIAAPLSIRSVRGIGYQLEEKVEKSYN